MIMSTMRPAIRPSGELVSFGLEPVSGLSDVIDVSVGAEHYCAVLANGQAVCWGNRKDGRLGDGKSDHGEETLPVKVSALNKASQVSAGFRHTCAAISDTWVIVCWGDNSYGELGNGTVKSRNDPAKTVGLP